MLTFIYLLFFDGPHALDKQTLMYFNRFSSISYWALKDFVNFEFLGPWEFIFAANPITPNFGVQAGAGLLPPISYKKSRGFNFGADPITPYFLQETPGN